MNEITFTFHRTKIKVNCTHSTRPFAVLLGSTASAAGIRRMPHVIIIIFMSAQLCIECESRASSMIYGECALRRPTPAAIYGPAKYTLGGEWRTGKKIFDVFRAHDSTFNKYGSAINFTIFTAFQLDLNVSNAKKTFKYRGCIRSTPNAFARYFSHRQTKPEILEPARCLCCLHFARTKSIINGAPVYR